MEARHLETLDYEESRLPSGIRVITESVPHVRSVAVGFWVAAGSRHESPGEEGASHFLEHLLFKGTSHRSAREIAEAFDSIGGQLNALTDKEYTCYHSKVLDEHFPAAFEVMADMLLNPLLADDEIERERQVILEEINSYEDDAEDRVHDLLDRAIWGDSHPLARPITGAGDDVLSLARPTLASYMARRYRPANLVVAVAGRVSHEQVRRQVEKHLDAPWRKRRVAIAVTGEAASDPAPPGTGPVHSRLILPREGEQVHVALGGRAAGLTDPDLYAVLLLDSVLGGGASSRLFQEVREKRGLAYSVYSFQTALSDDGSMGVYAASRPESAGAVIEVIRETFTRLAEDGVEKVELRRHQEQLKANLFLALESTAARMSRLGRGKLSLGRVPSPYEILRRVESVTAEDVARVARRYLVDQDLALVAVGPVREEVLP